MTRGTAEVSRAGARAEGAGPGPSARRRRVGWFLVAPAAAILLAVLAWPIADSLLLSFQRVDTGGGEFSGTWVGLGNYTALPSDPAFGVAVRNSLYFTAAEVVLVIGLGLAVALLLNTPRGRSPVYRVVLLVPWAIAPVANAVLWKWIYNSNYGILNGILRGIGAIDENVVWLGAPFRALNMLLVADVWKSVPFIALLLFAGLQNIPPVLYRAARLDGARTWQRFRFVTLPMLRSTLLIAVVLQSIWALKVFDLVYVLTKGGPGDGTVLLNFLAYRTSFNFGELGRGAAIANVLFVFMLVLAIAYVRSFRPRSARA